MSSSEAAALIERDENEAVDPESAKELLVAAVRLYCRCVEQTGEMHLLEDGALTATEVMVGASAILKCVNLQPFELGLWQAWHQ